ncbi:MAG: hypothetical protein NC390_05100 [Fusobacterium sp.]|nr:hypothetical protein [Fusobacterium sp.]
MNLTITPNVTQLKNSQQNTSSRLNTAGGGGERPLNGFNALGAKIFAFPALQNNQPSNLAPLARDTVSFGSRSKAAKKAAEVVTQTVNGLRADKVAPEELFYETPSSIAMAMVRDATVSLEYMKNLDQQYFRREVSVVCGQDRPIQEIRYRVKDFSKVRKKLEVTAAKKSEEAAKRGETFSIRNKEQAMEEVTDVAGERYVFRDRDKKAVAKVLRIVGQMIKDGKLKVKQIEVYYPDIESADSIPYYVLRNWKKDFGWQFSDRQLKAMADPEYFMLASKKDINSLADTAGLDVTNREQVKFQPMKNGYPALHLLYELPNGRVVEAQMMYRPSEEFKELLEDSRYKCLCNKPEGIYPQLYAFWDKLVPEGNKALRNEHNRYTLWTNITQLLKPAEGYLRRPSQKFLTAPDILLRENLGYNQAVPVAREAKAWQKAQKKAKN